MQNIPSKRLKKNFLVLGERFWPPKAETLPEGLGTRFPATRRAGSFPLRRWGRGEVWAGSSKSVLSRMASAMSSFRVGKVLLDVGECTHSISDASLSVPSGLTAHASRSDIVGCFENDGLLIALRFEWLQSNFRVRRPIPSLPAHQQNSQKKFGPPSQAGSRTENRTDDYWSWN
jgi:hypothetical protein